MIKPSFRSLIGITSICLFTAAALAVSSKSVRQSSASDFQKGKTENVVISSQGTLGLAQASATLAENFTDAWTINAVLPDPKGGIYIGTSPNGFIYKYSGDNAVKIYPAADANAPAKPDSNEPNSPKKYLSNEHVFAMGFDAAGRMLAGISGKSCKLLRFEQDKAQVIFEPNDASYIFAIAADDVGNIYLGTGPKGIVYRLNPFGKNPEVIYDSTDKNILSLAIGADGMLYAGSDGRGLVYRIDPAQRKASVLYDSEQNEITSLVFDAQGNLYAAASSAALAKGERVPLDNPPGRPDSADPISRQAPSPLQMVVPNLEKKPGDDEQSKLKSLMQRGTSASAASHVYRISPEGYVTDVFQDSVMFFNIAASGNKLLVATGNKGQLFRIDPVQEQKEIIYQDQHATQVTSVAASGDELFIGTSNPAKLIKISSSLAQQGTFTSSLVDAGQPAKWGKLQVTASIPANTSLKVSARTGNVADINDPTYSSWSEPIDANKPVQLNVPLGRFCQYRLIFKGNALATPIVSETAVPYVVPNLAPQVDAVSVSRLEAPDKAGFFGISIKASDRNSDKLIYTLELRKVGTTSWVKIKENLEADSYLWDSRTVEDGRYELRVTASDERGNTSTTKLAGSRVSEPVVVDNSGPAIENVKTAVKDSTATISFTAADRFSAIASVSYTVDSSSEWIGTLPQDSVYDTLSEEFSVNVSELAAGPHVFAVKATDAAGNTSYKSFELVVAAK